MRPPHQGAHLAELHRQLVPRHSGVLRAVQLAADAGGVDERAVRQVGGEAPHGAVGPAGQAGRAQVLALAPWPAYEGLENGEAEAEIGWVIDRVTGIRSVRAEMNIAPETLTPLTLAGASPETRARIPRWGEVIKRMARLADIGLADRAPEGRAATGDDKARADIRMPSTRHLVIRREDADLGGVRRILWRQHEGRLREVELVGDRLHLLRCQPFGIGNDGQRVAAETAVGEDIESHEFELHRRLP